MGLDYIRAETGKPWRKRWNRGLDLLNTPTLLDPTMSEAPRVMTAQLKPDTCVKVGDALILQATDDGLTVSDGLRATGRIKNPAPEMMAEIHDCGGYTEGVVQRVGLFGDTVEISVK